MEYRYRKTSYRCSDCKHSFDKIRKFSVEKYPHGTDLPFPTKDPECPECKKVRQVSLKTSVTDDTHKHINPANVSYVGGTPDNPKKTPSIHGNNNFNKAWDATQKMVAQDYQMTDLNTNLRMGDSMAPKLRPELEKQVDNVFKPQKPIMGQKSSGSVNQALLNNINAGRYANQSQIRDIAAQAADYGQTRAATTGSKVPTQEIFNYDNRGKPN